MRWLLLLPILLSGCTMTQIDIEDFHVKRTSFLQDIYVQAGYDKTHMMPYIIYSNDGGQGSASKIAEGAVQGLK